MKNSIAARTDLSLKLIALSHYVDQPTWKNRLGESWSVRKMVDEELSRKDWASEQAVTKLLALSLALAAAEGFAAARRRVCPGEEVP